MRSSQDELDGIYQTAEWLTNCGPDFTNRLHKMLMLYAYLFINKTNQFTSSAAYVIHYSTYSFYYENLKIF